MKYASAASAASTRSRREDAGGDDEDDDDAAGPPVDDATSAAGADWWWWAFSEGQFLARCPCWWQAMQRLLLLLLLLVVVVLEFIVGRLLLNEVWLKITLYCNFSKVQLQKPTFTIKFARSACPTFVVGRFLSESFFRSSFFSINYWGIQLEKLGVGPRQKDCYGST